MAVWYVDRGLSVLIAQEKELYPGLVVGTIGDPKHAEEISDHNPSKEAHDKGAVDAADFMIGGHFTFSAAQQFVNELVKYKDWRIAYIIFNGRIISSYVVNGVKAWTWRKYNGSDPHTNHVHLSVNDNHEKDASAWQFTDREDDMPTVTQIWAAAFGPKTHRVTAGQLLARTDENVTALNTKVQGLEDKIAALTAAVEKGNSNV